MIIALRKEIRLEFHCETIIILFKQEFVTIRYPYLENAYYCVCMFVCRFYIIFIMKNALGH